MKFKVGDKVRVRSDLTVGWYGADTVENGMLKYKGKEFTVIDAWETFRGIKYRLSGNGWNWTDEMLEDPRDHLKDFIKRLKV